MGQLKQMWASSRHFDALAFSHVNGGYFLFRLHPEMIRAKDELIRGIRLGQQDFLDQALNPDGTIHALLVDPADLVERGRA